VIVDADHRCANVVGEQLTCPETVSAPVQTRGLDIPGNAFRCGESHRKLVREIAVQYLGCTLSTHQGVCSLEVGMSAAFHNVG
jgi:hypothetical protein